MDTARFEENDGNDQYVTIATMKSAAERRGSPKARGRPRRSEIHGHSTPEEMIIARKSPQHICRLGTGSARKDEEGCAKRPHKPPRSLLSFISLSYKFNIFFEQFVIYCPMTARFNFSVLEMVRATLEYPLQSRRAASTRSVGGETFPRIISCFHKARSHRRVSRFRMTFTVVLRLCSSFSGTGISLSRRILRVSP